MARLLIVDDNQELASLLEATCKSRGHQAVTAGTGAQAFRLIEEGGLDAAVVDLLLPDVRGSEVLARLRDGGIPAIAMSGVYKGDRFAEEATAVHGAKAFLEKPFAMEALLAELSRLTGAPEAAAGGDDDESALDEVQAMPSVEEPGSDAGSAHTPLPFQDRESVWRSTLPEQRPKPKPASAHPASGQILEGTVPRLLNAYYQARHDGELKLKQGQVLKVVSFESGRPAYAASNLASERFGRFCEKRGVLPASEVEAVAQLCKTEGLRTGEAIVKLGLLTPERRKELLVEQVKEILWSALPWTSGEYAFTGKRQARPDLVKLAVFPGDLILQGVLARETLLSLRKVMGEGRKLFPTADPPYGLHEFSLSGAQALLLAYADGTKSVTDLLALTDLPEREALASLRGFELCGLIEERKGDEKKRRISFGL